MEDRNLIVKTFLIAFLISTLLLFRLLWTYISSIILALFIASVFYPLYSFLKKRLKVKESLIALLMTILISIIFIIPVSGFIGSLSNEAFDFYRKSRESVSLKKFQDILEGKGRLGNRIKRLTTLFNIDIDEKSVERFATSIGKNIGLFISRQIRSIASNVFNLVIQFFIMILIIYYILRDGPNLKRYIMQIIPLPEDQQEMVIDKFREMARAVIVGNGISGIIQGVFGGIGFVIFGLGAPLLWGTLIGVLAFLPIIGAGMVYFPASIFIFIQGSTGKAIGFLIYNLIYSSITEYIIKPRIIGKEMKMNPVLIFIGVFGGIKLFGILGVIYGPLILTIFLTMVEIYRMEYKRI